jgi:demethylmenaquinone methyltransferase/2-methoxy-6-polyprenyl-1,4-benzoquinol methylase
MTYTLPGTDDKSRYVEQKFDEIAQKYDRFNDLITFGMHRYWKRFVVRQTGLHPEEHCLDLAMLSIFCEKSRPVTLDAGY